MSTGQGEEVSLEREQEPLVLVPCHTLPVIGGILVGWLCCEAPLQHYSTCSYAHSVFTNQEVTCDGCWREYGVFANRSAPGGALVVTKR